MAFSETGVLPAIDSPDELLSICSLGHATTFFGHNGEVAQLLKEKDSRSHVIAIWGSVAAGKTMLVRRLVRARMPNRRSNGSYQRLIHVPEFRDGLQEFLQVEWGRLASPTANNASHSRRSIYAYVTHRTGWARDDAAAFVDGALKSRGITDPPSWGNDRHPFVVTSTIRTVDAEASDRGNVPAQRWHSILVMFDREGEQFNPGGGQAQADRDQAETVLWLADSSIPATMVNEFANDGTARLLESQRAEPGQSTERNAAERRLANANALENAETMSIYGLGRPAGVVLTKLDLVYQALERRHTQGVISPLEDVLGELRSSALAASSSALGALSEHYKMGRGVFSKEAGHLLDSLIEQRDRDAAIKAIVTHYGDPGSFWNFVSIGSEESIQLPIGSGRAIWRVEAIERYAEQVLDSAAASDKPAVDFQVRDVVSTVLGCALVVSFGYTRDRVLNLGTSRPAHYFLTSLVNQPGGIWSRMREEIENDTSTSAGVQHLYAWLVRPNLTAPSRRIR